MKHDDAKEQIRSSWRQLYPASKDGKGIICPLCGHGTHGDGITVNPQSKNNYSLKCFGCGFSGDVIDLSMQQSGMDYNTTVSLLARELNITIDQDADPVRKTAVKTSQIRPERKTTEEIPADDAKRPQNAAQDAQTADFMEYYKECAANLPKSPAAVAYLTGRGISLETAAACHIGFDPVADPAGKGYKSPRLIIPTSKSHYVARSIDPNTDKKYQKMNNKGGTPGIFNGAALFSKNPEPVFIVEGAFDAMSIIEAGGKAAALNSTSNIEKLIDGFKERRPTASVLVLALDNDAAGQKASRKLREDLQALNIRYLVADICAGHKDANEALQADREQFTAEVRKAINRDNPKIDNTTDYIKNIMVRDIETMKDPIFTGFDNLDKLTGGLYPGLYVVAAISSLGKTTFCHQMADNIAGSGRPVLFFSLEQSKLELVTKSISRELAKKDPASKVTSLLVRRGLLSETVLETMEEYAEKVQDRFSIIEGNFDCNVSYVADYVRDYIHKTETLPVVVVDYLQILRPAEQDRSQGAREQIDAAITALKRMSRDYNITVILVSSVNRANYAVEFDFEALKESGGIEYTADVVFGLQLSILKTDRYRNEKNITKQREMIKEAKGDDRRQIDLTCVKNRYGRSNFSCSFDYFPAVDLFKPREEEPAPIPTARKNRL